MSQAHQQRRGGAEGGSPLSKQIMVCGFIVILSVYLIAFLWFDDLAFKLWFLYVEFGGCLEENGGRMIQMHFFYLPITKHYNALCFYIWLRGILVGMTWSLYPYSRENDELGSSNLNQRDIYVWRLGPWRWTSPIMDPYPFWLLSQRSSFPGEEPQPTY